MIIVYYSGEAVSRGSLGRRRGWDCGGAPRGSYRCRFRNPLQEIREAFRWNARWQPLPAALRISEHLRKLQHQLESTCNLLNLLPSPCHTAAYGACVGTLCGKPAGARGSEREHLRSERGHPPATLTGSPANYIALHGSLCYLHCTIIFMLYSVHLTIVCISHYIASRCCCSRAMLMRTRRTRGRGG